MNRKYCIFVYEFDEIVQCDWNHITSIVFCYNPAKKTGIGFMYSKTPITLSYAKNCIQGWQTFQPYAKKQNKKEWKSIVRMNRKTARALKLVYLHRYHFKNRFHLTHYP